MVAEALYIQGLLDFLGLPTRARVELGASSAIVVGSRQGVGEVRHIEVCWLRFQQLVASSKLYLVKLPGATYDPDIGAKFISRSALERCRERLGVVSARTIEQGTHTVIGMVAQKRLRALLLFAMFSGS